MSLMTTPSTAFSTNRAEQLVISAITADLDNIAQTLDQQSSVLKLNIISKRAGNEVLEEQFSDNRIPYIVEVLAIDNPGIVYILADFFPGSRSTSKAARP